MTFVQRLVAIANALTTISTIMGPVLTGLQALDTFLTTST